MQHPNAQKVFQKRQGMVEPVFSSLRLGQALNRFRRRGLKAVKREFALHILAYNLSRAVALIEFYCLLWRLLSHALCMKVSFLIIGDIGWKTRIGEERCSGRKMPKLRLLSV